MSKVILLLVGAMWVAVLLPPLFRTRFDRPQSSVDVFRRQLNTLQNGTYQPRPQTGYRRPVQATHPMRQMARPFAPTQRRAPIVPQPGVRTHHTTSHGIPRPATNLYGIPTRELVRRRRQNIFNSLLGLNIGSLFLAFTTGSTLMIWVFAIAFLTFIGFCYTLAQIRAQQASRRFARPYYRAA
ncbi:MAG: hypothetical protein RIQ64_1201 [Actinomycetota bacterium]